MHVQDHGLVARGEVTAIEAPVAHSRLLALDVHPNVTFQPEFLYTQKVQPNISGKDDDASTAGIRGPE